MSKMYSLRWTNGLAVSGGIFWIIFHLYYIFTRIDYREIRATILIAALGVFFMAWAVFSFLGGESLGTAGKTGAIILLAGQSLVFLGAFLSGVNAWAGAWLIAIGGEAVTTLGLAAFSLGLLAENWREFWRWLPLILAPVYFVSFATTSGSFPAWVPEYFPEWLAVLYGMGWVVLGILLPRPNLTINNPAGLQIQGGNR